MKIKSEFIREVIFNYAEKLFDPTDTMKWLAHNDIVTMSWGFRDPVAIKDLGLLFRVNGHHHTGYVLITLALNDTYTVRFFSLEFKEVKKKLENVYCDVLQTDIDNIIEFVPEYKS